MGQRNIKILRALIEGNMSTNAITRNFNITIEQLDRLVKRTKGVSLELFKDLKVFEKL